MRGLVASQIRPHETVLAGCPLWGYSAVMELNEVLAPVVGDEDCVVYAVRCESVGGWRGAVAILSAVASGILPVPEIDPDSWSGPWYLVAGQAHGTLVRVSGHDSIEETIDVPDWDPAWKDWFERVEIGDRAFICSNRLDLDKPPRSRRLA